MLGGFESGIPRRQIELGVTVLRPPPLCAVFKQECVIYNLRWRGGGRYHETQQQTKEWRAGESRSNRRYDATHTTHAMMK